MYINKLLNFSCCAVLLQGEPKFVTLGIERHSIYRNVQFSARCFWVRTSYKLFKNDPVIKPRNAKRGTGVQVK